VDGFQPGIVPTSEEELEAPTDKRILVLASALKDGYTVDRLHDLTKIDPWFLSKLKNVIDHEAVLEKYSTNVPYVIRLHFLFFFFSFFFFFFFFFPSFFLVFIYIYIIFFDVLQMFCDTPSKSGSLISK
jgi:sensor histidine kinase YesM